VQGDKSKLEWLGRSLNSGFQARRGSGVNGERSTSSILATAPTDRNSSSTPFIGSDATVQYATDRERLEAWDGPDAIKKKFAVQLEERHQRDREPYVERLADLHCSVIRIMALEDICSDP
jgi:hypothetical protein